MVIWDLVCPETFWPKGKIIPITPQIQIRGSINNVLFWRLVHFHLGAHLNLSLLHKKQAHIVSHCRDTPVLCSVLLEDYF